MQYFGYQTYVNQSLQFYGFNSYGSYNTSALWMTYTTQDIIDYYAGLLIMQYL